VARGNRRVVVAELPAGPLEARHFRIAEGPMPVPGPGEVLCRTILASPDPIQRMEMRGRTYRGGLAPGDVMAGFTLSEVVEANGTGLAAGTIVSCEAGWQEYAALPASAVVPVQVRGPLTHHLSALGLTGLTAYFGLLEVGRPCAGETVVVSAAAGATGSVAGQLARLHGCRAVGITGSDAKRRVLEDELGFDATVSHRSGTLAADLRAACPDGIDVYFDNVGGAVLDACLLRMNPHGRVVCCGVLSQYDAAGAPAPGPRAVPGLVISRRLRLEGFVVLDFAGRWPEAQERLAGWIGARALRVLEEIDDGLDAAPAALVDVLAGRNIGKRIVRVGPDPA
jgi:NADPH-dependent curcumin reductase CurA